MTRDPQLDDPTRMPSGMRGRFKFRLGTEYGYLGIQQRVSQANPDSDLLVTLKRPVLAPSFSIRLALQVSCER